MGEDVTTALRLDVTEEHSGYVVAWIDGDDEYDVGAWVGQECAISQKALVAKRDDALSQRNLEEFEYCCVELGARAWRLEHGSELVCMASGYTTSSRSLALKLRNAVRAVRKAAQAEFDGAAPWPAWAKAAAENGWVPPKGWKP